MRRRRRQAPERERERALLGELETIYAEADALYAGHACPGSTECCRFAVTGREPYVTTIEVAAVERAVAARGGPLSRKRRALPLVRGEDEATCPLLDARARCSVYAARPLGCRTFWCDRTTADVPVRQKTLNAFVRRVRELAERHAPGAVQGRPLRKALRG
jgi:Fe-S-cluster containining protein